MVTKRAFVFWFFGGLAAFAVAIWLHLPLAVEGVPEGIAEHQRAPDAATVDAIHAAWQAAGVYDQARIAMIADLIFIGIYGIGCVLGGLHYRGSEKSVLKALGWIALLSGVVFLVTDYGETIAQFIQLQAGVGDDGLANLASTLRPPKMLTWTSAFLSLVVALLIERFSRQPS